MEFSNLILAITLLSSVSYGQNTINHGNLLLEHFLNSASLRNQEPGGITGLSFPFTKWCGPGSTAQNFDDLGADSGTDICCREHDHCDHGIKTGDEKCQFKNNGFKM